MDPKQIAQDEAMIRQLRMAAEQLPPAKKEKLRKEAKLVQKGKKKK